MSSLNPHLTPPTSGGDKPVTKSEKRDDNFTDPECVSPQRTQPIENKLSKPPNILVYLGESDEVKLSGIKQMCVGCLGINSYTVYPLQDEQVRADPWQANCCLLIIAKEMLDGGVDEVFYKFFASGGRILSFCSNFDERIVCLVEHDKSAQVTVAEFKFGSDIVKAVQGRHYYKDTPHNHVEAAQFAVITANSHGQPAVVDVSNPKGGSCILSQIHLERSPSEYSTNQDILSQLTSTESGRISAVKQLFKRLGLASDEESAQSDKIPECTTCYALFTSNELPRDEFISEVTARYPGMIKDGRLVMPDKTEYELEASPSDVEQVFNWQEYREALLGRLGNTLIYQQTAASTQDLLTPFLSCCPEECGMVAIAQRQLSGRGRGQTQWLSPLGQMPITMHIRIDKMSNLGKAPYLIQTIPTVAVCRVISTLINMDRVEERLMAKWPNDIYIGKAKIGGVLVESKNTMDYLVGVGVNVTNRKPTTNINQVVEEYNLRTGEHVKPVSVEFLAASVCSEIERLIDVVQKNKSEYMPIYYENWMHEGGEVDVPSEEISKAKIVGLDDDGSLLLRKQDGETFSVKPDGNSFDVMHNLIRRK